MKDGFTLIEVSILFIIFIIVAVLIVPLSVDDVILAKNVEKWKQSQLSLSTIPVSMMNSENAKAGKPLDVNDFMSAIVKVYPLKKVVKYKVKYYSGDCPCEEDCFKEVYMTNNKSTIAFKWLNSKQKADAVLAKIMFDVNGKSGPNVWGKDIFGLDVYEDKILPFGHDMDEMAVEIDTSRQGTGKAFSAKYLIGVNK